MYDDESLWEHDELKKIQDTITDIIDPKFLAPDDIIEDDYQSVMDGYLMKPPPRQCESSCFWGGSRSNRSPIYAQRVVGVENTDALVDCQVNVSSHFGSKQAVGLQNVQKVQNSVIIVNNHKSVDKKDAPKDSSMHLKPLEALKNPPSGSELKDAPLPKISQESPKCFPSLEDAKKIDKPTDDAEKACSICMEFEKCVAVIPCGHVYLCLHCASKLTNSPECAICRASLKGALRLIH
jgi:hypothetical protein